MATTTSILPLKEGSSGRPVTIVQGFLKTLKLYAGATDGIFGAQTKAAVIKFQQNNKLTTDGIVGPKTAIALDDAVWVSQQPTLQEGSKGEKVKGLQELLDNYYKDVKADGNFAAKTKAVVIDFQKARGLKADGIVGPATWASLRTLATHDISEEDRIEDIFS